MLAPLSSGVERNETRTGVHKASTPLKMPHPVGRAPSTISRKTSKAVAENAAFWDARGGGWRTGTGGNADRSQGRLASPRGAGLSGAYPLSFALRREHPKRQPKRRGNHARGSLIFSASLRQFKPNNPKPHQLDQAGVQPARTEIQADPAAR